MSPQIDINTFNQLKESAGAEFIGELVDTFLEDAPALILQMKTALAAQDADSFRRAAHSMKSNAATFGALELSVLAKDLELMGRDKNLEVGDRLANLEETYRQVESQLKALK